MVRISWAWVLGEFGLLGVVVTYAKDANILYSGSFSIASLPREIPSLQTFLRFSYPYSNSIHVASVNGFHGLDLKHRESRDRSTTSSCNIARGSDLQLFAYIWSGIFILCISRCFLYHRNRRCARGLPLHLHQFLPSAYLYPFLLLISTPIVRPGSQTSPSKMADPSQA